MGKIFNALEKYRKERKTSAATRMPELQQADLNALSQYNKRTGKLNLYNKSVVKDAGTIQRLLANNMILPDGKLTIKGIKKCKALWEKKRVALAGEGRRNQARELETDAAGDQAGSHEHGRDNFDIETQEIERLIRAGRLRESDLTILMGCDRDTGHLLTYAKETDQLNNKSVEIMKDRGVLRRLLSAKLIYPGGKLTPSGIYMCAELTRRHENGRGRLLMLLR